MNLTARTDITPRLETRHIYIQMHVTRYNYLGIFGCALGIVAVAEETAEEALALVLSLISSVLSLVL